MSYMTRCQCCGDDFMTGDFEDEPEHAPDHICSDCEESECEANGHGEYDDCQRTDMDEDEFGDDYQDGDFEPGRYGDGES